MKKVLADGSIFSRQIARGISNYFSQILSYTMKECNDPDIALEVLVFDNHKNNLFLQESGIPASSLREIPKTRFFYSMFTGKGLPDAGVFHSPYMFLPPKQKGRVNLLTIHDLINLEKEFTLPNYLRKELLKMAIHRADHYICISNTTKQDLLKHFPEIDDHFIHVIHQGIDDNFLSITKSEKTSIPVQKDFLLYVGQRAGYKNFRSLLEFFKASPWNEKVDIICAGGGSFTSQEIDYLAKSGLTNKVKHTGFVTTRQLKYLYENAFALLFTSLAEGFGLPIIEAMACKCPVICGNFSSMKEVSGGMAILMEDFSARSFEESLVKAGALTTAQRDAASEYAKTFSWNDTARKTFLLYKMLLAN